MKKILAYAADTRGWLLGNQRMVPDNLFANTQRPRFFFLLCIIVYCIYMAMMQPSWVFGGEMWAEAATNYFPAAKSSSLAVKFLTKDVGYVPLPQRILAAIGNALNLPARSTPYFYTWSAIILAGAMVGSFCLAPFRALVKNDFLRLFAALAVVLVADFETRTFINFTYFAAFFATIIAALAFVENRGEVPRWSWCIPILMISKPAALAALPIMVLAALVSGFRFRLITAATILLCLAQMTTMFFDPVKGFVGVNTFSFLEKSEASVRYFFGLLGVLFTGEIHHVSVHRSMLAGLIVLSIALVIAFRVRRNASALILAGLSLVVFNTLVHCFALPAMWNTNMECLNKFKMLRYVIVAYSGVVLLITGLIASITEMRLTPNRTKIFNLGPIIFLVWFFGTGWFYEAGKLGRAPEFPKINNSQWQQMADVIDSKQPVCVPVDPIDMMYVRNCKQINTQVGGFAWPTDISFEALPTREGRSEITLTPPPSTLGNHLISLAIMLKPVAPHAVRVDVEAALKLKDGTIKYLIGFRQLPAGGGLVMLQGKGTTPVDDIAEVHFTFSTAMQLGYSVPWQGYEHSPVVFWFGH